MNNSTRLAALLIVAALLGGVPLSLASQDSSCIVRNVPVSYDGELGQIQLVVAAMTFRSEGILIFRNNRARPVVEITIVIDYLSSTHERLSTLIFHNGLGPRKKGEILGRRFSLPLGGMSEPLASGLEERLSAFGLRTSTACPSSAQVTFVTVTFNNGTVESYKMPGWHLDPEVEYGNDRIVLDGELVQGRAEFFARGQVTSAGELRDLTLVNGTADNLLNRLKATVYQWKFLPETEDGHAVNVNMLFLFRFQSTYKAELDDVARAGVSPDTPFAVVDFVPYAEGATRGNWVASYSSRAIASPPLSAESKRAP